MSSGTEAGSGFRMKQSSRAGAVAERVKGWLAGGREGCAAMVPRGMRVGERGRYWVVPRVTIVPSMVGAGGLRLK